MTDVKTGHSLDSSQKVILGFYDKAPPRPDTPRAHQRDILLQREVLNWTEVIGHPGEHDAPFHDGRPEVDGLGPDGRIPEFGEGGSRVILTSLYLILVYSHSKQPQIDFGVEHWCVYLL